MLKHYSSNLLLDMNLAAKKDTLEYISANMVDAPYFERFGITANESTDLYKPADAANQIFNRDPEGRGEVPFRAPYLDFGNVRIKKQFVFDR